jgi:ribose-phosphate pyrophosphokinase
VIGECALPDDLKVFSGTANRPLAEQICRSLGIPLGNASITRFSDGEIYVQILENVRGQDVFVIQPTCTPVDSNLFELLLMIDAFKRSSARRITAVLPYYGYARQDRKDKPRVPISAKLVADVLSTAGASRALTMDLHVPQIQGFFDIPVDHLFAAPVIIDYFQKHGLPDLTVISPDAGGTERARAYAKKLHANLAIIDKRRKEANVAEVVHIIGEVKGRSCLIVDDIVDTAGTLVKSVGALLKKGARAVYASCTHPVLSGPAVERIRESCLTQLVVTNSIALSAEAAKLDRIKVLSVAELLGKAIRSIHEESSVSSLFI